MEVQWLHIVWFQFHPYKILHHGNQKLPLLLLKSETQNRSMSSCILGAYCACISESREMTESEGEKSNKVPTWTWNGDVAVHEVTGSSLLPHFCDQVHIVLIYYTYIHKKQFTVSSQYIFCWGCDQQNWISFTQNSLSFILRHIYWSTGGETTQYNNINNSRILVL